MRRTKATLSYKRTKNPRAVQLLLGHCEWESTVRYVGIEVDDALGNLAGTLRPLSWQHAVKAGQLRPFSMLPSSWRLLDWTKMSIDSYWQTGRTHIFGQIRSFE
jgi:hypothetical protein